MCRLCFFNDAWIDDAPLSVLEGYFSFLEKRQGGSGNGVAAYKRGRGVRIVKGVHMTPRACAEQVLRWRDKGYQQFIFHTRMATSGLCDDINCHPFSFNRHSAFAHNGHNHRYVATDSPVSDSYLMALALHQESITIPELRKCHGTFVGWSHGQPFAVADSYHDIQLDLDYELGAWCIASEIPADMRQGAWYDAGTYLWVGRWTRTSHGVLEPFPDVPTTSSTYYDAWGDYEYGRSASVYTPKAANTSKTVYLSAAELEAMPIAETWPDRQADKYWQGLTAEERADWEEWIEQEEQKWARARLAHAKKEGYITDGNN